MIPRQEENSQVVNNYVNGATYEEEEINSIEEDYDELELDDSSDIVKNSSKVSSRRASQKEVEDLEREVSQLKNQLGVFEVPMDLDAFTFRVVSTRQASLHITDSLQFPSHTVYKITKMSPNAGMEMYIFRRYSDFTSLSCLLEREFPLCLIPKTPPKRKVNNTGKTFVKFRLVQLNMYLHSLLTHPKLKLSSFLKRFLHFSSEQWQELVETEDKKSKLGSQQRHQLSDTKSSAKDLADRAKDFIFKKYNSITGNPSPVPKSVTSSEFPDSFNKFALGYEKLHIFSYVRVAERTSSLSVDALTSVVTEVKRIIKLYELKAQETRDVSNLAVHMGMTFGGTDNAVGPHIFSLLQIYAKAAEADEKVLVEFCSDLSGVNFRNPGAEIAQKIDQGQTLLELVIESLSIIEGLESFFEANAERVRFLQEKQATTDEIDKIANDARSQLEWAREKLDASLSPKVVTEFANQMSSMYYKRVAVYENLLQVIDSTSLE